MRIIFMMIVYKMLRYMKNTNLLKNCKIHKSVFAFAHRRQYKNQSIKHSHKTVHINR